MLKTSNIKSLYSLHDGCGYEEHVKTSYVEAKRISNDIDIDIFDIVFADMLRRHRGSLK